jgi:serine/threonine protein kinase
MKDGPEQGKTSAEPSVAGRIDATSDAFEEAWNSNPPARIEDFLTGWEEPERSDLFHELIRMDLEFRRRLDRATFSICEYYESFPEYHDEIDTAVREASDASRDTDRPSTIGGELPTVELQTGDQIGDFDLISRLGDGAFAVVYLAYERSMMRHVALKVSRRGRDEPPTLGQLDHPNIVRVHGVTRLDDGQGLQLMAMEYVAGGTLQEVISKLQSESSLPESGEFLRETIEKRLSEDQKRPGGLRDSLEELPWGQVVCVLGIQLAEALAYAHGKGILHRDIKPANVLLTVDGTPKLADFNIAYGSHVSQNAAGYFGGTLAYMSPEQLEACDPQGDSKPGDLDHRSDIYSLAVVLWELLSGRRPFEESTRVLLSPGAAEERRRGVTSEVIAKLPTTIPTGMQEVLCKCLESDPKDRYQSGKMARDLRLCTKPLVQTVLRPPASSWLRLIYDHPVLATIFISLIPNVVLSVANVTYDWTAIVQPLAASAAAGTATALDVELNFFSMLIWMKAVLYACAVLFGFWRGIHVFLAMREGSAETTRMKARRDCLKLGDLAFGITLSAWLLSGVPFRLWMYANGADLSVGHYFLFFSSHLLCGLIAGNLVVFTLTYLQVRLFYPRLLSENWETQQLKSAHARLRRRVERYFMLAVATPFISALALGLSFSNTDVNYWPFFLGLGLLGAIVFILGSVSKSETNRNLDALDDYLDLSATHPVDSGIFTAKNQTS